MKKNKKITPIKKSKIINIPKFVEGVILKMKKNNSNKIRDFVNNILTKKIEEKLLAGDYRYIGKTIVSLCIELQDIPSFFGSVKECALTQGVQINKLSDNVYGLNITVDQNLCFIHHEVFQEPIEAEENKKIIKVVIMAILLVIGMFILAYVLMEHQ